jgi:hypothetical protein
MTTETLVKQPETNGETGGVGLLERVVIQGDLSKLAPVERVQYYNAVCRSIGVNPLTRPFDYIVLNGKLQLYAKRDCTDQLRRLHGISVEIVSRERLEDLCVVTARAVGAQQRHDESIGVVAIQGLRGEALANAMMKAETKAKRRVTLSLCGLGLLDESEVDDALAEERQARPAAAVPALEAAGKVSGPPASPGGKPSRSYEPFGAVTMVTELAGKFDGATLERYFGPGIRNKTALETLKRESFDAYVAGYDKLHDDYDQGKAGVTGSAA